MLARRRGMGRVANAAACCDSAPFFGPQKAGFARHGRELNCSEWTAGQRPCNLLLFARCWVCTCRARPEGLGPTTATRCLAPYRYAVVTSPAWQALKGVSAREGLVAAAYERRQGRHSRVVQMAKLYLFGASSGAFAAWGAQNWSPALPA